MENPTDNVTPERRAIFEKLGRRLIEQMSRHLESRGKEPRMSDEERKPLDTATPAERAIYERYNKMLTWVVTNYISVGGYKATAQKSLAIITRFINDAISGESFDSFLGRLPAVVVGKDFLEIKRNGVERYFAQDDGKDARQSVYDILMMALRHFLATVDDLVNPLITIRDAYKANHVNSPFVLQKWHVANQHGFYELKSGDLSKVMTRSEYDVFLEKQKQSDLNSIIANHLRGGYADYEENLNMWGDSIKDIKWHDVTDVATNLTKWDAIQVLDKLYDDPSTDLRDMVGEFPELVSALTSQIENDFKISINDVPVEKWREPFITRRSLYKTNFYGVRRTADTYYKRDFPTGIAIVQDVWDAPSEKFYDRPRPIIYADGTMKGFMPRFHAERADRMEREKRMLVVACRNANGYNFVVESIADIFNVKGFLRFIVDMKPINDDMITIKNNTKLLQKTINELPDTEKYRTEKLQAIKDHFLMPRLKLADVSVVDKPKIRRMIANLSGFQDRNFAKFSKMVFDTKM